ncbi:amidohydrolase family protein, partial [Acidobacteria bacterium AH-259-D05]|nr:amidohydrolase family protein [Acidobacteria bacterium AH-259-D05]
QCHTPSEKTMTYDLGIEGGTLVSSSGQVSQNIYIQDGVIANLTTDRLQARRRHDASNLFVLPGMIDGHVHFQDPGDTDREDFVSGSGSAAVGGVTTVIEHTHSHPVRNLPFLREKMAHIRDRSVIDYGLGAHVWPQDIPHVAELWGAGMQFFKVFTCTTHGVPAVLPGTMLQLFQAVAECDGLCLIHCEDEFITAESEERLKGLGRKDYGILSEWRSREAEQVASSTVALLARLTGAKTIIAHVSHPQVLDLVARDRQAGAKLWVESCPQYLYLSEADVLEKGPFRKFTPPARSEREAEELWDRLAGDEITHISSDHAPATLAQKEEGLEDMWNCHFGLPGTQTTLTMLLNGVNRGRLTLEQVVQLVSENPAKLYRMWPQKGNLQVGADADMVLIDMSGTATLTNETMLSKAGWTPYEGMVVQGLPVATYLRGNLVASEGQVVVDPGVGRFLPGPGAK